MKIYPRNKEHYKKLILFAKKIIKLCKTNKINLTVYGSFAHFNYTKDKNLNVNDIDFYVKEKDFSKLIKLLEKNKIKHKYSSNWRTLQIFNSDLRIEIDSLEFWYKGKKDFSNFYFNGSKIKVISLKSLERLYKRAYKRTKDNKEKILTKMQHLNKFLKK